MPHDASSYAHVQSQLAVPIDILELLELVWIQLILIGLFEAEDTVGEKHEFVVDGWWDGVVLAVAEVFPTHRGEEWRGVCPLHLIN